MAVSHHRLEKKLLFAIHAPFLEQLGVPPTILMQDVDGRALPKQPVAAQARLHVGGGA